MQGIQLQLFVIVCQLGAVLILLARIAENQ